MNRWLFLALAALPFTAGAVVIRDDVDDARYQIDASVFPALADMPGEGHGVLIAPRWVLTAAHAAPMEGMEESISINGRAYAVERVFVHPGFRRMPEALGKEALATGNPSRIHAFLAASDDIALISACDCCKGCTARSALSRCCRSRADRGPDREGGYRQWRRRAGAGRPASHDPAACIQRAYRRQRPLSLVSVRSASAGPAAGGGSRQR